MAALRPVLQNETDARGEFSVRLGRGSYHLEAADADLHAETSARLWQMIGSPDFFKPFRQ